MKASINNGGKGSGRRATDRKKFDDNWDLIFGNKDTQEEKLEDYDVKSLPMSLNKNLVADVDGYYNITIGIVEERISADPNIGYSMGCSYETMTSTLFSTESIKLVFGKDNSLISKSDNGILFGELGNPQQLQLWNNISSRLDVREYYVDLDRICCLFKDIELDLDSVSDQFGYKYIKAKVKPAGLYGYILKKMFDDNISPVFAMRMVSVKGSDSIEALEDIITIDLINGILE